MDEQRMQAYVELITQLLGCEQGKEVELLQANAELVDAGLLTVIGQYADFLESQGNGNAGWLRQFSAQLAQSLNLGEGRASSPSQKDAGAFALEIIQLIWQTRGDRAQVYAVFQANVERLDEALLRALPDLFAGLVQQNEPSAVAAVFVEFGNLIAQFPLGNRMLNLEQAIAGYQEALTVMTQAAMPVDWATTMMNLATAYYSRIRGDRAENIEQAIAGYQSSLEVFLPELLPDDCRKTARSLASLYGDQQCWEEAAPMYQKALKAAETLYQSAILLDSKVAELAATADLPRRAAYALARTGDLQAAALTLEQGRARGLSESLERDRANLTRLEQTTPQLYQQYQSFTTQLRNLEGQQRNLATSDQRHSLTATELRDTATALQNKLTQTITEIRQVEGYDNFLAQPGFEDIRAALHPDNPLIYLVTTPNGSMALIVTADAPHVLWLDALTEPQLINLLSNTWFAAYSQSQTNRQSWYDAIDTTTRQLWHSLMEPVIQQIKTLGFERMTLIPTGYLSFLPLHAAWTEDKLKPNGRRYALDDLHSTYTPNALSFKAARTIAASTLATNILAINEPQPVSANALPSSSAEAAKAISTFPDSWKLIQHEKATRTTVLEDLPHHSVVHFSCHGSADFATPLNSGLAMANDEILSLRDFLDLQLQSLRLVVLSACETGIPGTALPDEVVSLPTGLLQAGVAGVVSSLWSVADLSTMVLLSRFYDLWRTENLDPPTALRQAQIWLRDSTGAELAPYLQASHPDLAQKFGETDDQSPFAHPFHWAAFTYVGV